MTTQLLTGVRAVVFDAVGTLLVPDPPAPVVYANFARRHGLAVPADLDVRFNAAYQAEDEFDRERGWRTGEARERERWRRIVSAVLGSNDANLFSELWGHFANPSAWRLIPGAAETIAGFQSQQLELGVATNFDRRFHQVVAGFTELIAVRHRFVSSEIGWRKPAREFFDVVVRTVGFPADHVLHVGDNRESDYAGAKDAGLRAVLVDPGYARNDISAIATLAGLR